MEDQRCKAELDLKEKKKKKILISKKVYYSLLRKVSPSLGLSDHFPGCGILNYRSDRDWSLILGMLFDNSENRFSWHHEYTNHSPNDHPGNRPTSLIPLPGGPTVKSSQIGAALLFLRNTSPCLHRVTSVS